MATKAMVQRSRMKAYFFVAFAVLVGSLAVAMATSPATRPSAGEASTSQTFNNVGHAPGNYVTRGRLSQQVSNAAGFHEDAGSQLFQDVPQRNHYFKWVNRLANRGLVSGRPCGVPPAGPCVGPDNLPYFSPDEEATRGQISKVIANAAGFSESVSGQTFEDVPPGSTFHEFVERLASRGLMEGVACGTTEDVPCVAPDNRPYFLPFDRMPMPELVRVVNDTFHGN